MITIKKRLITAVLLLSTAGLAGMMQALPLQDENGHDFEMVAQNMSSYQATSLSFSPDGKYFVVGSDDSTIKLYTRDLMFIRAFDGHSERVVSVSFAPDGEHFISGSQDRTVKLWNIKGQLIRSFDGFRQAAYDISFSADAKYIFIESPVDTLILDIGHGVTKAFESHPRSSHLNATSSKDRGTSPDGKHLVSSAGDNSIKLSNTDGTLPKIFKNPYGSVQSVLFTSDSRFIVSRSSNKTTQLWDMDGKIVAASTPSSIEQNEGLLRTYGTYPTTSSQVKHIHSALNWNSKVAGLAFSPDGKYLASGSWDRPIKLWSTEGNLIRSIGRRGTVRDLVFSPDSKYIYSSSEDFQSIFSPDGKYFLSAGYYIRVRDLEGNQVRIMERPGHLLGSNHGTNPICLWSQDGNFLRALHDDSSQILSAAFSPDGEFIATGGNSTIKLWSISGNLIRTISAAGCATGCASIAFTPDGEHIVAGAKYGQIDLWSKDGTFIRTVKKQPDRIQNISVKMSLSPDGKHIVSGPEWKEIKVFDLEGNVTGVFKSNYFSTPGKFSSDGKHIAVGSPEGTIDLWNPGTAGTLSLFAMENEWIMYTPDGYFDASPQGGKLVAMVKGLKAYGVDQFAIRNNRPDLILDRMGLGTRERINYYNLLYQKRLNKSGLTEAALRSELHAPEAGITAAKQDGKLINIDFHLSDSKYPLKSYNIYVNGVSLFGSAGKEINGNSFKGAENIELAVGSNKIELSAMNSVGAESYRALINANYSSYEKGALYYLAFGVSKYKDPALNLNYADKDVKDLGDVVSKMLSDYSSIHKNILLNTNVTSGTIRDAKGFLTTAGVDDTVILAIAGHGGYDKGRNAKYYFVAYDTDMDNLAGTGVDFESIEDLLKDIKPRKKLLLLDTCESGEVDENTYAEYYALAGARGLKPRTYRKPLKTRGNAKKEERTYIYEKNRFIYNNLSRRTGAIVFSSSKGGEISYESSAIQNGFFTKEIITALTSKTADKNSDGKIDSGELRDFVTGAVTNDTGGLQHPTIDRDNLHQKIEFPLVLN